MHIGSVLLAIWLVIGGIAAGQRGDYKGPVDCSRASTVAVTIIAGPLNYVGVNPIISCTVRHPNNKLWRILANYAAGPSVRLSARYR